MFLDKTKLDEVQDLILDLGWECQRMSQSGVTSYNNLCDQFNIETYEE